MRSRLHGKRRVEVLLEARGAVRAQGEALAGQANLGRREGGQLQQHLGRALLHFGSLAAHDPGQGDRLATGGDQHVGGGELALFPVQGRHGLAVLGVAHQDAVGTELAAVEQMIRLGQVQHHEVRDVHEQVDGTLARGQQQVAHPLRGLAVLQAVNRDPKVAAATLGLDLHRHGVRVTVGGQFRGDGLEVAAEDGRHFAGDTAVAPEVGAVREGLVVDLDDPVVVTFDGAQDLGHGLADHVLVLVGSEGQHPDAVVLVAEPQLALGADHADGLDPADLGLLNLECGAIGRG